MKFNVNVRARIHTCSHSAQWKFIWLENSLSFSLWCILCKRTEKSKNRLHRFFFDTMSSTRSMQTQSVFFFERRPAQVNGTKNDGKKSCRTFLKQFTHVCYEMSIKKKIGKRQSTAKLREGFLVLNQSLFDYCLQQTNEMMWMSVSTSANTTSNCILYFRMIWCHWQYWKWSFCFVRILCSVHFSCVYYLF